MSNAVSNTPESAVAAFMQAWQAQDWDKMIEACQLTWRASPAGNTETLRLRFGSMVPPASTKIIKINPVGTAVTDVYVAFDHALPLPGAITMRLRTVCETGPYQPSIDGTWGVNPVSAKGVD